MDEQCRRAQQKAERAEQQAAELRKSLQAADAEARPAPKFRAGQSVLHWWAIWFRTAEVVPTLINKGMRPKWYVSEVINGHFLHKPECSLFWVPGVAPGSSIPGVTPGAKSAFVCQE